jgi:alkanesulfonate monooxygenase
MSAQLFFSLPSAEKSALRAANQPGGVNSRARRVVFSDPRGDHFNHYDALFQVARAAEAGGFNGVTIPWSASGEDPWIAAASLSRATRRLVLLPELQIGFATPVYLAKMSVSFQRLAAGRLAWHFALESDSEVRRAHGDFVAGGDWYARADEYFEALKGVSTRHPYDFQGRFYGVEKGGFEGPLAGVPVPALYTSGSSDEAIALAAKHADVHVLTALSPRAVEYELARLNQAASERGRRVQTALSLGVITRHTAAEADEALAEAFQDSGAGRVEPQLDLGAGVWSGFRRLGFPAEFGLVGSHAAVAAALDAYLALGIDNLILSGLPELREAYRLGEHVLPRLASRVRAGARLAEERAARVA